MKKLIVGLVAAIMVAAGLVASTGVSTATAAPYPGTVSTDTSAAGVDAPPRQARVYVQVTSDSGKPKGRLNFVFVGESGKTYEFGRQYAGRAHTFTFARLTPGKYTVLISFVPPEDSKWKPSSAKTRTNVDSRR